MAFKDLISPLEQRRQKYLKKKTEFGSRQDEVRRLGGMDSSSSQPLLRPSTLSSPQSSTAVSYGQLLAVGIISDSGVFATIQTYKIPSPSLLKTPASKGDGSGGQRLTFSRSSLQRC